MEPFSRDCQATKGRSQRYKKNPGLKPSHTQVQQIEQNFFQTSNFEILQFCSLLNLKRCKTSGKTARLARMWTTTWRHFAVVAHPSFSLNLQGWFSKVKSVKPININGAKTIFSVSFNIMKVININGTLLLICFLK